MTGSEYEMREIIYLTHSNTVLQKVLSEALEVEIRYNEFSLSSLEDSSPLYRVFLDFYMGLAHLDPVAMSLMSSNEICDGKKGIQLTNDPINGQKNLIRPHVIHNKKTNG